MRTLPSLTSRLVVNWTLLSLLVFFTLPATVIVPLAWLGYDDTGYGKPETLTARRARGVIMNAVRQAPNGSRYIEMTDELRAYLAHNPNFLYAVYDPKTGALFEGSSVTLADYFSSQTKRLEILGSTFHVRDDPNPDSRGSIRMIRTSFGRFGTILYGSQFHWDDLLFLFRYFPSLVNIATYLLLFVALSFVALIVVRRSLEPLSTSAATVSRIDLDSLDQRVSTEGLPSEVVPFIDAVNTAFSRVDEGVARQRRFIANSAHELRTPVAILRTRLEKLDEACIKQELKRDAQRIQTILEQLLVLAQVEERGTAAPMPELDLGETALAVTADYTPLALSNGRRISFEPPPHPVVAKGYKWAVESVVTNLLENAVRAEPAGGTVIIRVTAEGVVEVEDHGEGVDEAHRQTIFEPFWRKSEATPGTGLGLAIAKELTEKLHGRIWVEETPCGGATFKLAFATAGPG